VLSQSDILSTASTITGTFTLLLAAISGISLIVGGIGIMNMMLTTVTERTREIGLRKAIGARPVDITSQFLAEAITLCLIGGVIGISLGWGISAIITATGVLTTEVSLGAVAIAVGVCAGIGIVFGYYPARRASMLDPIEALATSRTRRRSRASRGLRRPASRSAPGRDPRGPRQRFLHILSRGCPRPFHRADTGLREDGSSDHPPSLATPPFNG